MARITGVGGVFFQSKGDSAALAAWYRKHLGMWRACERRLTQRLLVPAPPTRPPSAAYPPQRRGRSAVRLTRAMTGRLPAAFVVALAILASDGAAQAISFRIGPGLAYADGFGYSGLVALEARWRVLIVRADAHMVYVPADVATIGYAGVAVGVAPVVRSSTLRPYLLATVSKGADIREADELATVGLATGVDLLRTHVFGELRYENSLQRPDPFYYTLPEHQLTFCVGLRIGRSRPS